MRTAYGFIFYVFISISCSVLGSFASKLICTYRSLNSPNSIPLPSSFAGELAPIEYPSSVLQSTLLKPVTLAYSVRTASEKGPVAIFFFLLYYLFLSTRTGLRYSGSCKALSSSFLLIFEDLSRLFYFELTFARLAKSMPDLEYFVLNFECFWKICASSTLMSWFGGACITGGSSLLAIILSGFSLLSFGAGILVI